ncbi:beta-ketoacyl-ACP synthase III [Moritella viscosa]|uniref:3-oxoacyl-(Acyl carrier protein) synthase n=1 Tax=Moritella viscosa TaxID=80854 RepID=A0ABY1HK81_9GAMM|nr:beta-ketoacyl-ACP synthase III [Moritella viscosa]SGZ03668.1 3-oxoacyl-(Acyl carrier protein) synthase [Moritella viscosa]SGZ17824.1 3-oxoacyl-(Acyl carrier protein) synthase [Moritella viscosa]SHO28322.1 3-oxoacyl-(Acyl carrier protein) synthase [Moritella viscosa]
MSNVVISGSGLFTPPDAISNDELVTSFNCYVDNFNTDNAAAIDAGEITAKAHSSSEFIEKASGIKSRFVMSKTGILDPAIMRPVFQPIADDEPSITVQMALVAAKQALASANKEAKDIDLIIFAASGFQRAYPAMAVELQYYLGANGFAYDMSVACSSATFAIANAMDAVKSGRSKTALVVNPEICSAHLNFKDRDSHFIFGDVCTAVVIENKATATSEDCYEIIDSKLFTQYSNNIRNNLGYLSRSEGADIHADSSFFMQNGRKVFKEVLPTVYNLITEQLNGVELQASNFKRLWLHQANINMNNYLAKKLLGRDPSSTEAPIILDEYANTASAGSIIAFHLHQDGMESGDLALICSFGAGYSVGSLVLKRC